MPLMMVAYNAVYVVFGLLVEGRVKMNAARYLVAYTLTIRPAMNGDLMPFIQVCCQPPG